MYRKSLSLALVAGLVLAGTIAPVNVFAESQTTGQSSEVSGSYNMSLSKVYTLYRQRSLSNTFEVNSSDEGVTFEVESITNSKTGEAEPTITVEPTADNPKIFNLTITDDTMARVVYYIKINEKKGSEVVASDTLHLTVIDIVDESGTVEAGKTFSFDLSKTSDVAPGTLYYFPNKEAEVGKEYTGSDIAFSHNDGKMVVTTLNTLKPGVYQVQFNDSRNGCETVLRLDVVASEEEAETKIADETIEKAFNDYKNSTKDEAAKADFAKRFDSLENAEKVLNALDNNEELTFEPSSKEVAAEDLSSDQREAIKAKFGTDDDSNITYYDLSYSVKNSSGAELAKLTELYDEIEIQIAVGLAPAGIQRTYSVIRYHAGEGAAEVRSIFDSATGILTVYTNKFSYYGILALDTPETQTSADPANPANTGEETTDNVKTPGAPDTGVSTKDASQGNETSVAFVFAFATMLGLIVTVLAARFARRK